MSAQPELIDPVRLKHCGARRLDLVSFHDGTLRITYRDEAEMRDALATVGDLYGWKVAREVPIPEWGRIDLMFISGRVCWVVELKRHLTQTAAIRKGLQQAYGYSQWVAGYSSAYLVASKLGDQAERLAAVAFPDVKVMPVGEFMAWLCHGNTEEHARKALERRMASEHELRLRRLAMRDAGFSPEADPARRFVESEA